MSSTAGIVGAGVLGRMMAVELNARGWAVSLYDRDTEKGEDSCSWTGAGMIAPYCELEAAEQIVTELGVYSKDKWPGWLERLAEPVFYKSLGSLVVAHPNDRDELLRLRRRVLENAPRPDIMEDVGIDRIRELEPELAERFRSGLYFPFEEHLDNRDLMRALGETIRRKDIEWNCGTEVTAVESNAVVIGDTRHTFDWVLDCRGLGAQPDLPHLRGVRGELLYLHAPEVNLSRPVRLMHPRYSIYIVPRAGHVYVVGATAIESDNRGPITVRSALELLSAAYTVHTGFAEATLIESSVNCRPGFPDNLPRILPDQGLIRINGLYRHGFLIAPALVDIVCEFIDEGSTHPLAEGIMDAWQL